MIDLPCTETKPTSTSVEVGLVDNSGLKQDL